MKKKILALTLCVVMAAIAIVGGTLAYFTDTDKATNTFTVGNIDIDLTEPKWDAIGEKEAADVYPGEALAKDPTVKNDGFNPCFVRIKVTNLDPFGTDNMITYRTDYVEGALGTDWERHTDGYFYYTKVLAAGATTDALFDQIVMPVGLTNNAEAEPIVVYAEAVQAQGARPSFSAVEAMTVAEISDWFTACMPANNG